MFWRSETIFPNSITGTNIKFVQVRMSFCQVAPTYLFSIKTTIYILVKIIDWVLYILKSGPVDPPPDKHQNELSSDYISIALCELRLCNQKHPPLPSGPAPPSHREEKPPMNVNQSLLWCVQAQQRLTENFLIAPWSRSINVLAADIIPLLCFLSFQWVGKGRGGDTIVRRTS